MSDAADHLVHLQVRRTAARELPAGAATSSCASSPRWATAASIVTSDANHLADVPTLTGRVLHEQRDGLESLLAADLQGADREVVAAHRELAALRVAAVPAGHLQVSRRRMRSSSPACRS